MNCPDPTQLDGVHLASIYLATVIGSVTFAGSLVAFGKLDGRMSSVPLKLGLRDQINMGLGAATAGAGAIVMSVRFVLLSSE
jgi:NAD(P) transhydrogenase